MKRTWIVDDAIPLHVLLPDEVPRAVEAVAVRILLRDDHRSEWAEEQVRDLCKSFCDESTVRSRYFAVSDAVVEALNSGETPPDVLVMDWEGTGSTEQSVNTVRELLERTGACVQIYTKAVADEVTGALGDLPTRYGLRLLPIAEKGAVNVASLRERLETARAGRISVQVAEDVRQAVMKSTEHALRDLGSLDQDALARLVGNRPDLLAQLLFALLRDRMPDVPGAFDRVEPAGPADKDTLRRLLSTWYYYFPTDDHVRRGDIVTVDSEPSIRWLVATPACDLARFARKTGGALSLVRMSLLGGEQREALRATLRLPKRVRDSMTAGCDDISDCVVVLPNVPTASGSRAELEDCVVLAHEWRTIPVAVDRAAKTPERLTYTNLVGVKRRCAISEPFLGGILGKIHAILNGVGVPNWPETEKQRINESLAG
jgi:hypothetical protein